MKAFKRLFLLFPLLLCLLFVFGCKNNKYTDDEWTITFQNYDGSFISYTKVKDGEDAAFRHYDPMKPSDETHVYVFDGWDKPLTKIREDGVRIAQYRAEDRYYTVSFRNGSVEMDSQKCLYGGSVTYKGVEPQKAADSKGTYSFSGWDIDLNNIKSDCVAHAEFTLTKYEYDWTFYDEDGRTVLATTKVKHGEKPVYPNSSLPTKAETNQYTYSFIGWDNISTYTTAAGNGSSKAVYKANIKSYKARFVNYDGTLLLEQSVNYGSKANYSGKTPTKASTVDKDFNFSGWDKDLTITKNTEFKAQYQESTRTYKVVFVNYDKKELYSQMVPYGGSATYSGSTPTKESDGHYNYTFSGWNGDYSKIVQETTIVAGYSSSINIDYFTFTLSNDNTYYVASLKYSGNMFTEFYVPETYNDLPVKEVSSLSTTYVQNIYLPNSIEKINDYTFNNCTNLKTISLGTSLKNIGISAFKGCKSLETISLNEGLTFIADSAFNGCSKLSEIVLPRTLEYLGTDSFYGTGLTGVIVPENVTTMYSAFKECKSLQSAIINANVDALPTSMFKNCTSLNEAVIGSHIEKIGSEAFAGCSSLSTVVIPSNVTTLLYNAFSKSGITTLVVPETVTSLNLPFENMTSLLSVTLNASVDTLAQNSFYQCTSLKEVVIGAHITTIGQYVFNGCRSLKTIDIPSTVTTIQTYAFSNSGISSIVIPETVTSLGQAFKDMASLQSATINANVDKLVDSAFQSCTSLTEVVIGAHITTIGQYVFNGCRSLKEIFIMNSEGNVTINDTNLDNVTKYYYSKEEKEGNYWHYVDGVITKW